MESALLCLHRATAPSELSFPLSPPQSVTVTGSLAVSEGNLSQKQSEPHSVVWPLLLESSFNGVKKKRQLTNRNPS